MTDAMDLMIDNLVDSLDPAWALENSYVDFHVKGLTYINLFRSDRMTVKLYLFDKCVLNSRGHLVYPHNHSYNFYHKTLVGNIHNIRFKPTGAGSKSNSWQVWQYNTSLKTSNIIIPKLQRIDMEINLDEYEEEVKAGQSYYLNQREIHTIVPQSDFAVAGLIQFHDISKVKVFGTTMFVPPNEMPKCDKSRGLYKEMNEDELGEQLSRFYNVWKGP